MKYSKESNLKNKLAHLGKKATEETKLKMSLSKRGKQPKNIVAGWNKGKTLSPQHIENLRKSHLRPEYPLKGENNPMWKGGLSKLYKTERQLLMTKEQYKNWRRLIFIRDNFTCQYCKEVGGILNAHHIKEWSIYPELRFDIKNGIALCEFCHRELHKILIITKKNVTTT